MDETTRKLLAVLDAEGRQLHVLLVRLTLREDVAEDLLQDLFVKLQSSKPFHSARNPAAYAKRVAIHLAFDWRRQERRRSDLERNSLEPPTEDSSPLQRLVDVDEANEVLDAAGHLPELSRDCFLLRYVENESYERIADNCGKTPHQVRALCHKAIRRLRTLLGVVPAD